MKTLIPNINYTDGMISIKLDAIDSRGDSGIVDTLDDILDLKVYSRGEFTLHQNPLQCNQFSGYIGKVAVDAWFSVKTIQRGWVDFQLNIGA